MQGSRWLLAASAAGTLMLVARARERRRLLGVLLPRPARPGQRGGRVGRDEVRDGAGEQRLRGRRRADRGARRSRGRRATSSASWTFAGAAPARSIVRFAARRSTAGLSKSLLASDLAYILETDTATLEKCAPSTESSCIADLSEPVAKEGLNGSWVRFRAICTNAGDACSSPLRVDTTQVNVGLKDLFAPTVAKVKLLDDGDQSGKLTVGFDAADLGGGLYRTVVKIDGKVARATAMGGPPCADALASDADPYQFDVPVPCPRMLGGRAGGGRRARAGARRPRRRARDRGRRRQRDRRLRPDRVPAGQRHERLDEGHAEDVVRARASAASARSSTSRLGRRVVTRGILRNERGVGIQGARIDVYHVRKGKRRLLKTGLKTRAARRSSR